MDLHLGVTRMVPTAMSLVGRTATNHPQQVGTRGARPEIDDRAITVEDFVPLNERFRFTVDAAATERNARLPRYWTVDDDGLTQSWAGERVWCNPPHSAIAPWIWKTWMSFRSDESFRPPELAVMLLPANRTEQGWWQNMVEPYRDGHQPLDRCSFSVEFLRGRMRFLAHHADSIKPNERPPYGCCLLIWTAQTGRADG